MGNLTQLYSMEEASQHSTMDDCWIVVDGKVYDVTSYLDDHPGGDEIILAVTGKDATDEFEDAGHSKDAKELLQTYCIGELDPTSQVTLSEDPPTDYMQKARNLTKQYWLVPMTIVGISVIVGFLFFKKKQHN